MTMLCWDKPKKAQSTEEWAQYSADGAPPGVYSPNMSRDDKLRWKAKHFGGALRRVEIRKTAGGSQVKIVVSLSGQPTYRQEIYRREDGYYKIDAGHDDNVVISMNGPARFSFEEMAELQQAITEAKARLERPQ